MRLSGVPYDSLTSLELQLLENRLSEKNQLIYFQLTTVVSAIQTLAQAMISGEANFTKTTDSLRMVKDILFPELKVEVVNKAEKTKEIMEKELAKGPMGVQRLDYGSKKKKRR